MLTQMLDWATSRGAEEERLIAFYHMANGSVSLTHIMFSFHCMCVCSVAGKLKGLFLLFAGHIVKNAATLLQKSNTELQGIHPVPWTTRTITHWPACLPACLPPSLPPSSVECSLFQDDSLAAEKTSCLLSHLLSCLHKCFLHSQASSSSFLTRERFNTLMQPLVQQVSFMKTTFCV